MSKNKVPRKVLKVCLISDRNRRLLATIRERLGEHGIHIEYTRFKDFCDGVLLLLCFGDFSESEARQVPSHLRESAMLLAKPAKHWPLAMSGDKQENLEQRLRDLGFGFVAVDTNNEVLAQFLLKHVQDSIFKEN